MSLEDYQAIYQPVFSRFAKFAIVLLTVAFLVIPFNSAPYERQLYQGVESVYSVAVNSPQELIETYLVKKLNLHLTYNETDPRLILQKQQRQAWLLKNWLFWGPFFVFVFPLTLFLSIGFIRKVKAALSRSRLAGSYEGMLLWEIKDKVRRVSWRVNFFSWEKVFIRVLIMGLFLFFSQFAAQFFLSVSREIMRSLLLSFLIYTAAVYIFYLYYDRYSEKRVIGFIDARMGLKERLLTSLERPCAPTPLYSVVLEETSRQLRQRDAGALAPHRFPRPGRKGLWGMLISTLILAMLISVATPHAALLVQSYRNYFPKVSPAKKWNEAKEVEKVIRKAGEKLTELVDEFESESDEVKFTLDETRRLGVQMASFDVEKPEFFINPPKYSDLDVSPSKIPPTEEDEETKSVKKRNEEYEKNVRVSQTPSNIRAYQHHQKNEYNFNKISGELSRIAMEMIREGKTLPTNKNKRSKHRNSFLRKNLINNARRDEDIQDNAGGDYSDGGNTQDEDGDDKNNDSIEAESYWEGKSNALLDRQKDTESDAVSLKSSSPAVVSKARMQDQTIDPQTLKALMDSIFSPAGEQQQAKEENSGRSEKQKATLQKNDGLDSKEDSVNNMLNQMPSLSQQDSSQQDQEHSRQKSKPHLASGQTIDKPPKKNKGKTAMPQSRAQKKSRDFSKKKLKKKDVVILNNPRNIEIAEEAFEETSNEYKDWYMEDWVKDSQGDLPDFDSLPLRDNGRPTKVLGKRIDILAKSMVLIKNPSNVTNPRAEMRDAVASVESPEYIQGLPKKLSQFVKDVTDPKRIEVFTSHLNKLGKSLDDWERANTPKSANRRSGMSQQKAVGEDASWTEDEVEIGGRNPKSNKSATVIRGSKTGRGPDSNNKKFRIEKFPEHIDPHKDLTNISQDLSNLNRELTNVEDTKRQALLGRMETSGNSPETSDMVDRRKLQPQPEKTGNRFDGTSSKEKLTSDPSLLRALSKTSTQSRRLGNMLMERPGASSSPKANKKVQNVLKENKKNLQQMAERIRDQELTGSGDGNNFSEQLSRMASKTRNMSNQQSPSESKDSIADDIVKKALRQKADSIEQLREDLRKRYPKGNSDMARRFSSLAKSMDNIGQGLEMGKSIGGGGGGAIGKSLKQNGIGSMSPQDESKTRQIKEYIKKQKTKLNNITRHIQQNPANLSQAAKELRKLSDEMEWEAAKQKRSLDKDAANSLNKIADQAKKLAADMKREAQKQKPKVTDVIKAVEETMQDTKKKIKELKKADSSNPAHTAKKEKKIAALSKEMERLDRLKSRLGADRTREASQSDKLQNQSGLQLKKMAAQLNKDNKLDTARKLSGGLEKMIQQLKNRPHNRDKLQKLGQLKEKLDERIEKGERERENTKLSREIKELARQIQQEKSKDKVNRLSSKLSGLAEQLGNQLQDNTDKPSGALSDDLRRELDKTKKDIKQLSDKIKKRESVKDIKKKAKELEKQAEKTAKLTGQEKKSGSLSPEQAKKIETTIEKARKLSRKIQNGKDAQDIKKFTAELDEISNKMADMSMGMKDGFQKRSLQDDSVREVIRDVGDSLKEITQRLDENIDRDKISSDLTDLSEELANLDLGGEKKIDSDENITESDKKIINETGTKLKELADKAITQKNPKDVHQMATDLINLAGNLSNLDLGKSEQQGKKSTSKVTGKNREFRGSKLKQLANKLKGSNKMTRQRKIASQISKFVSSAGPQDAQRTQKTAGKNKNNKQGDSTSFFKRILNLPQFFRKDKKIKEQKDKSTKERDKNDLTRTAAVNKIDKLIKNLKRKKKKLPGTYNSKRVLKKAGVSSKGAGSIQKGIVGKMTQSNYSKAKFSDSNVSKDINILPNSDIVNNTYVMEQRLTDKEVFEQIIKRLEKNRKLILAEGEDPHKVLPVKSLPLSKDYQPRPRNPIKQPIEGDEGRMMAGLGAPNKVEIPGTPQQQEEANEISTRSFMDRKNNSEFLKMPIKLDKNDTASLPSERLQKLRGRKPYRLNASQAQDDSTADQSVPEEYMDIIRQLYLHLEEAPPRDSAPVDIK